MAWQAIADFAEAYADQNECDYAALQAAVKDGTAEVTTEICHRPTCPVAWNSAGEPLILLSMIIADHPAWGEARVVRRTAWCGNVE